MFLADYIDFIKFLLVIFTGAVVIVSISVLLTAGIENYTCSKYEEVTGVNTKYAGLTCYINTQDGYMSYEEYKLRNITNH